MLYKNKILMILILILTCVQFSSAAHYVTGYVKDALDGESANGKIVTLWNPANGINDNTTGIVGVSGSAGYSNVYMIDCELLDSPCEVGDILSLKIFGSLYITYVQNVTITGEGYDLANNLSLNSPPFSSLNYPVNNGNYSANVNFNCSFSDQDDNIENASLYGNWSGGWHLNETDNVGPGGGSNVFSKVLAQGTYLWNCLVYDNLSISSFAFTNNSFFVDATNPVVTSVVAEDSDVCGFGYITVNCSAYDADLEIGSVIIQANSPTSSFQNYSAGFVSGTTYSASVSVDEIGEWNFRCFANDSVGNMDSLLSSNTNVESGNPELYVVGETVSFDKSPSYEGEEINVSVTVGNSGCADANNFIVGFSNGESPGGNNFENTTISVGAHSSQNTSVLFSTVIGNSNIFVYADFGETITEDSEANNSANNSLYLKAWQKIFGNLTLSKVLIGNDENLTHWGEENTFNGNIFVADTESQIEWNQLQAIGRTKTDTVSSNDFSEIDTVLGMSSYNDSIYDTFTNSGTPKSVANLYVFQNYIQNIPFVNSSVAGNFATGILWDMSDSVDSEYDSSEGEDIVLVTQINMDSIGDYGTYDYEIDVPSKLRSYDSGEESQVYLYYDLN